MLRTASCLAFLVAAISAPAGAAKTSYDFVIKSGHHRDSTRGSGPKSPKLGKKTRTVTFKVLFTPSTAYKTSSPHWNKLMGITTNRIHHNSIRLGWAYVPAENKMSLGFYGYL